MLMKDNCARIFHLSNQYYNLLLQNMVLSLKLLILKSDAIFYWFAVHYVFNIQNSKNFCSVGYFLHDNIFDLTDRGLDYR